MLPKVAAEWLAFLRHIRNSRVQILIRRPVNSADVHVVFLSLQANAGFYLKLGHDRFLPRHSSLITLFIEVISSEIMIVSLLNQLRWQ
jgi:hypothetical protein